jgi:hypothetical protein
MFSIARAAILCAVPRQPAFTERTRAAAGVDHNVRMDLMKCGQVSTTAETVRPAGAEAVHQPIEGFQRLDAIDVLRIFVEHYTGF